MDHGSWINSVIPLHFSLLYCEI